MKLIIDIPEEDYIRLRDEGMFGNVTTFKRAVREGTPLAEQEPCADAISRAEVLSHAKTEWGNGHEQPFDYVEVDVIKQLPPVKPQYTEAEIQKMQDLEFAEIQKAYEIGKDEGSEEKPNKWIPVSERYPTDANKSYLVCYEDGCITIEHLYFDGDGYPFFSEMELGVVAWMPLPEPYKAESEDGEQND